MWKNKSRKDVGLDGVEMTDRYGESGKKPILKPKKSIFRTKLSFAGLNLTNGDAAKLSKLGGNSLLYTDEELKEYRMVFELFDTDGSGAIGTGELGSAMTSLGMATTEDELHKLIKEVDEDGNGEIDFDEFCSAMRRMSNHRKPTWDAIIKDCYKVFDNIGGIADSTLVIDLFREADVDDNGVIDYDEFSVFARNYLTEEDIR